MNARGGQRGRERRHQVFTAAAHQTSGGENPPEVEGEIQRRSSQQLWLPLSVLAHELSDDASVC